MQLLNNKNILLGVTGSIAVYKSLELIRLYIKAGANVKVIMTVGAQKFISKLTFETISQNKVLDESNEDWSLNTSNNHIAIGKWADLFVLAPTSANTINKMANGIADNLLLQTVLAYPFTKLLCPAANTNMIQNPISKKSLKTLAECDFKIVNTITKELACKDVGDGAMADINDIFNATARELLKDEYWLNRKVVLNGGGSVEKIDEVRYISNFSSGKMAVSIAKALYFKGAEVTFIKTPSCISSEIDAIDELKAEDTSSMLELLNNALEKTKSEDKKPYFFAVAAISDYVLENKNIGKIKKDEQGKTWNLELKQNIDVLSSIQKEGIYCIGFKAELDKKNAHKHAKNMLVKKELDGVCLNILDDANSFGKDTNSLEVISNNKSYILPSNEKLFLALELLETLKEEFNEK